MDEEKKKTDEELKGLQLAEYFARQDAKLNEIKELLEEMYRKLWTYDREILKRMGR